MLLALCAAVALVLWPGPAQAQKVFVQNAAGVVVACEEGTTTPPSGPILSCTLVGKQFFRTAWNKSIPCAGGGPVQFNAAGAPTLCELPAIEEILTAKPMVRCAGAANARFDSTGPLVECKLSVTQTFESTWTSFTERGHYASCAGGYEALFSPDIGALLRCTLSTRQDFPDINGRLTQCAGNSVAEFSDTTSDPERCSLSTTLRFTQPSGDSVNCMGDRTVRIDDATGAVSFCFLAGTRSFMAPGGARVRCLGGEWAQFFENGRVVNCARAP